MAARTQNRRFAGDVGRTGKDLLDATRPFAEASTARSWWYVASTLAALGGALGLAALLPFWPLKLVASLVGGLLIVRTFILFHDHMHGALLSRSRVAGHLFALIGLLLLAPSRYWRYSHNFHHGNVGKPLPAEGEGESLLLTSDLGSFPLMTTSSWRSASVGQRLRYRALRHPLTLLFAYVTVFLLGLTVLPLARSPRRFWDGAISVLVHGAVANVLGVFAGLPTLVFGLLLPFGIGSATGAYLFFAQHNFSGMRVMAPDQWTYYLGATESSSYMELGRVMRWFTGNIGYHHVHHLNPRIPFYLLPEALAAVPELQQVGTTSLRPRDIIASLRLNLWDSDRLELVGYRAAGD